MQIHIYPSNYAKITLFLRVFHTIENILKHIILPPISRRLSTSLPDTRFQRFLNRICNALF